MRAFFMLLSFLPIAGYGQWVKLEETPGMTVYAHVDTMLAKEDNRVATVLIDFKDSTEDDLASKITVERFDCEKRFRQSLRGEHFSEQMGQGKPNFSYSQPAPWKKVERFDGWDSVFKLICG